MWTNIGVWPPFFFRLAAVLLTYLSTYLPTCSLMAVVIWAQGLSCRGVDGRARSLSKQRKDKINDRGVLHGSYMWRKQLETQRQIGVRAANNSTTHATMMAHDAGHPSTSPYVYLHTRSYYLPASAWFSAAARRASLDSHSLPTYIHALDRTRQTGIVPSETLVSHFLFLPLFCHMCMDYFRSIYSARLYPSLLGMRLSSEWPPLFSQHAMRLSDYWPRPWARESGDWESTNRRWDRPE
ncbi:hypothetical protein HDK90DRAFT_462191 [Phyllosticta capitalensis]|uniref:Uncharacterized protein n=1 Tax=Phyllosticta capitalensis TaxID=121624 RepID=A0ABR1Z5V2_9PEZI